MSTLQEWFTLAELVPHVGTALPGSLSKLTEHAEKAGWRADKRRCQMRWGKGGGYAYHYSLFPAEVQAKLTFCQLPPLPAEVAATTGPSNALWTAFERAEKNARLKANERLSAITAVDAMEGMTRAAAVAHVAALRGIAASALWGWIGLVKGVPRADRLPALLPRHVGRTATAECDPRAWDFLLADYLRLEAPCFEACERRMREAAAIHGWNPIPSARTLKRRIDREVSREALTATRKGREALHRLFPAQQRDRTHFGPLQAVTIDGHRFDVFVQVEGERSPVRVMLVAIQDLGTGLIVGWNLDLQETRESVRLAIADMVEHYGVPEDILAAPSYNVQRVSMNEVFTFATAHTQAVEICTLFVRLASWPDASGDGAVLTSHLQALGFLPPYPITPSNPEET